MSMRTKLAAALAIVAVLVSVLAAFITVGVTRQQMTRQLDESLAQLASAPLLQPSVVAVPVAVAEVGTAGGHPIQALPVCSSQLAEGWSLPSDTVISVTCVDGRTLLVWGQDQLQVPTAVLAAARRSPGIPVEFHVDAGRVPYRGLVTANSQGESVSVAKSLAAIDQILTSVVQRIIGLGTLIALLAAGLGRLASDLLVRRSRRLTTIAEVVASTGDPATPTDLRGKNETGRLARAFENMLVR